MNWKTTVVLLVAAAAVVWFYSQDVEKVEQEKQAEKAKEELIQVEANDIMSLAFERPGEKTIAAVREGDEWILTEPVSWPGDKAGWDAAASTLASAKIRRTFPDEGETLSEEDLTNWGLKPAGIVVRATVREGSEEFTFGFGNSVPGADSSVYATSSALADMAVVVPKAIITNASRELQQLREKKYLNVHFERDKPSRIEVSNKDLQVVAEQVEGDNWFIASPEKVKGDPTTLRKYVDKLGLESIKIVDEVDDAKLASVGLADDQIASATRYKIGFGDSGDAKAFYVGKFDPTEGGHWGRREGTKNLFIVSEDFFDGQPKTLGELRPKKAILTQKWNANVVSATSNGQPLFHLAKEDFKWRMVSPHSATAEREVVDKLIDAFNEYTIGAFVTTGQTDAELGLEVPILSLTISGDKGPETVHFGSPDEVGGVYAAWEGLPDRFVMDRAILDRVLLNPLNLLTPGEKERISPSPPEPEEGEEEVLDLTEDAAEEASAEVAPEPLPESSGEGTQEAAPAVDAPESTGEAPAESTEEKPAGDQ